MTAMSLPRPLPLYCAAAIVAAALSQSLCTGQADDGSQRLRRILVPADAPGKWPQGNWRPIQRDDLEKLLTQQSNAGGQPRARLTRATYSAVLEKNRLTSGRVEFHVAQGSEPGFVTLDPLDVSLSKLRWSQDEPAIWGMAPDGSSVAFVDRLQGRLVGDWNVLGRALPRSLLFEFHVAPATVTELVLTIPADRVLYSNSGIVHPARGDDGSPWKTWKIDLGSETTCRIAIRRSRMTPAEPLPVVRRTLNYVARPDGLRIQAEYRFRVLEAPLEKLTFRIDPNMQVHSVVYGASSVAHRIVIGPSGDDRTADLEVVFPTPLKQREDHLLTIHGVAPLIADRRSSLPRIEIAGDFFSRGQLNLRVLRPLQLHGMLPAGYRQVETDSNEEGESFVFEGYRSSDTLEVSIGEPALDVSCDVHVHAHTTEGRWVMNSHLRWTARAGDTYSVRCRIPEGWDVTRVRSLESDSDGHLSWEIEREQNSQDVLVIAFRDALSPLRSKLVEVAARRLIPSPDSSVPIPAIQPLDTSDSHTLVSLVPGGGQKILLEQTGSFAAVTREDLSQQWKQTTMWKREVVGVSPTPLLLISDDTAASGLIHLQAAPSSVDDDVDVDVRPEEGKHAVVPARDSVTPVPLTVRSAHVFSRVGPDAEVDLHWVIYEFQGSGKRDVTWELPPPARLISVRQNRLPVEPTRNGSKFRLAAAGGSSRIVEIHFSTPARGGFGRLDHEIVLPRMTAPVLRFEWKLALPPGMRADLNSKSGSLLAPPAGRPQSGWSGRLFGPLGRSAGEHRFDPFGWSGFSKMQAAAPKQNPDALRVLELPASLIFDGAGEEEPEAFVPAGWTVWRASLPSMPESLPIVVWDARQLAACSWAVMLIVMIVGIVLSAMCPNRIARCGAVWLSVCIVAVTVVPDPYSTLVGASLVGAVFAALFHLMRRAEQQKAADPPSIPLGSTRSYATHVSALLLVGLVSWSAVAWGQDAAGSSDASTIGTGLYDVLIPTDRSGRPQNPQRVFVREKLIQQLKSRKPQKLFPPYLVSSAHYDLSIRPDESASIVATFDVVLTGKEPVRVLLPITNANLAGENPCLVDGRPVPVLGDPGKKGIVIVVGERDTEGDSEQSGDIGKKAAPSSAVHHSIQLELHPPVEPVAEGHQLRMGVPKITDSTLVSRFGSPATHVRIGGDGGRMQAVSLDQTGSVETPLARSGELRVRWSATAPIGESPAETEVSVASIAEVTPSLIRVHTHFTYRVLHGIVDAVTWSLPEGAVVIAVEAGEGQADVTHFPVDGKNQIVTEFRLPQTSQFELSVEFLLARKKTSEGFVFPALNFFDAAGSSPPAVLSQELAVHAPLGFRPEILRKENDKVKPIEVDEFLSRWKGKSLQPQLAFQILRPTQMAFGIGPLSVERRVQTTLTCLLGRRSMTWKLEARLDVDSAAVFQHRLRLDPRLRIVSASVQQDGAERLLRLSPSDDEILLFLKDGAQGQQTIQLTATMPLVMDQKTDLPRAEFLDAVATGSTLILRHPADLSLDVVRPSGTREPAELPMTGDNIKAVRIDAAAELPRVSVRVSQETARITADSVTVLETSQSPWRMTTRFLFHVKNGRASRFVLRIPRQYEIDDIQPANAEKLERNGFWELVSNVEQPVTDHFVAGVTVRLDTLRSPILTFPEVRAAGVEPGTDYLVIPPDADIQPDSETAGKGIELLPAQLRDLVDAPADGLVYQLAQPFKLQVSQPRTEDHSPIVSVKTRMWIDADGMLSGETMLFVMPNLDRQFVMKWPTGTNLRACVLDGRVLQTLRPRDGTLQIPLDPDQRGGRLSLYWTAPTAGRLWPVDRFSCPFPTPAGLDVGRYSLSIVPPPYCRLKPLAGLSAGDSLSDAVDDLESEFRWRKAQTDRGSSHQSELWDNYLRRFRQVDQLVANRQTSQYDVADTETRERIGNLRKKLSGLGEYFDTLRESAASQSAGREFRLLEIEPARSQHEFYGILQQPGRANITLVFLNARIIDPVAAALLVLALLFVCRTKAVGAARNWFVDRPRIAWVGLGLFWWMYWTASWLGLLIVILAVLSRLFRPKKAAAVLMTTETRIVIRA